MPSPDYTPILTQIRLALNTPGETGNVSVLVREVREAIHSSGSPSLRDTLVDMRDTLKTELSNIRNILAGGPGAPSTGRPGGPSPEEERATKALPHLETEIRDRLTELTRAVTALTDLALGHGGAAIPGLGGGATTFDTAAYSRRIDAVRDLVERSTKDGMSTNKMLREMFTTFFERDGIMQQQYMQRQKDAVFGLVSLATKTTDLIYIFERLGHFIKAEIVEKYTGFMANRSGNLSGSGYMFDEFKRIAQYMTGERPEVGYGNVATNESIKRSVQSGLSSPMLMYGQNVEQLSATYRQMIGDLEKRGANPRSFGSPEQLQALFDTVTQLKNSTGGPFQQMRAQGSADVQQNMLMRLAEIAKYTGLSTDKLIELVKAATQESAELSALGLLTQKEAQNYAANKTSLEAMGPAGKEASTWISKFMASGRDPTAFIANNPEAGTINALSGGSLTSFLSKMSDLLVSDKDIRTQIPAIIGAAKNEGGGLPGYLGGMGMFAGKISPQAGALGGMISGLAGLSPNMAVAPDKTGMVDKTTQLIEDITKQFPIFSAAVAGFGGLMLQFGIHVAEFAVAARMLGLAGGGGLGAIGGGALGYASKFLGGAARIGGGALGGIGGAIGAAADGSSGAGIAGGGIGGAAGAYGGMALGSLVGPVGTAIGGVVGGFLGSYLGEKLGNFVSPAAGAPAVASPQNIAGPIAAAVAGVDADKQRSYQDQQILYLSGLLSATVDGNSLLGQMYTELGRQTASLTGTAATASTPQPGRGLSVSTPAVSNSGRPDASTGYTGPGY